MVRIFDRKVLVWIEFLVRRSMNIYWYHQRHY